MSANLKVLKQKNGFYVIEDGKPIERRCLKCGIAFPWKRDTAGKYCKNTCYQKSDELKERYAKQFKGKLLPREQVEKGAAKRRGRKESPEHKKNRLAWRLGMHDTQETKDKRNNSLKDKKREGQERLNILNRSIAQPYGFGSYAEMEYYPTTKYTLKYEKDQKKLALQRDGYKCLICGSTDRLEVDHIIDKRRFLIPNNAHDLSNLISLCRLHHKQKRGFHYKEKQKQFRQILSKLYGYTYRYSIEEQELLQWSVRAESLEEETSASLGL